MLLSKRIWLVVPTYGVSSCTAYFDELAANVAAAELGTGMAKVAKGYVGTPPSESMNGVAKRAYEMTKAKGFWDGEADDVVKKLLLIHSEVSEAAEALRAGDDDVRVGTDGKLEGTAVELADVLIRTLDLMHAMGVDVEDVVRRKMEYNATRGPKHGKRF